MLEVRNLAADYGDVRAVWDVSLQVGAGEIVTLIGPNGAGKTTLMQCISGLHRPSAGSIDFEGAPLHTLLAHRIVERGVVLVPEGRRIFAGMRVLENLEIGAFSARARRERASTLEWIFQVFPILAERRNHLAGTLSGGQQQMLAIGRALMGLPRLLLLDEPSLGLAPLVVRDIFGVLKSVNERGLTVLLVEQNARAALRLASRAYVMEQGRVAGEGSGSGMMTQEGGRRGGPG